MRCRQLSFYAQPAVVESAMATIANEVVPQYEALPHFIG